MRKTAALVVALLLLMGACSGSRSEDPKAALISAMENTAASEGLTTRLSLRSTPESLDALARADGGTGIEEEDAEKILTSSITVSTRGSGEEGSFEMVVNIAGEDDFEMKAIDQVLYFRADVQGLVETFGGDPSDIGAAVEQAEAQGLGFVRPAAEGRWMSIEGLKDTAQQMTGQTPPALPKQEQLIEDLTESFEANATVTSKGREDVGEHLVVSVPLKATYESFAKAFAQLGRQLPVGQLPDVSEVPNEEITLHVWVDDDRVTQVDLDLIQVARLTEGAEEVPEDVKQFGVLAQIEEFEDEIEVPENAVAIDPQQIFGLLGGLVMGGMGAPGSSGSAPGGDVGAAFNCDDLRGAPPNVLSQFAEECPELQP